jgi:hypothetical protein
MWSTLTAAGGVGGGGGDTVALEVSVVVSLTPSARCGKGVETAAVLDVIQLGLGALPSLRLP